MAKYYLSVNPEKKKAVIFKGRPSGEQLIGLKGLTGHNTQSGARTQASKIKDIKWKFVVKEGKSSI